MTRRNSKLLGLALLAGVAVTACQERPTLVEPVGEAPLVLASSVNGKLKVASRGASQVQAGVAAQIIGPLGGKVSLPGLELSVPAGALSAPVLITMTVPPGDDLAVVFAPHGLEFAKPATISFGMKQARHSDLIGVYHVADIVDGLVAPTETFAVTHRGNVLTFDISHFSGYCLAGGRCSEECE
jgi:hypothetical protein